MNARIQTTTRQPARLPLEVGRAYAAGIVDGEGCIHIARQLHPTSRRGYVYRIRLSISQNHLATLIDFQNLVGIDGLVYQVNRTNSQNRDSFQLTYDGRKAPEVIRLVMPYLNRKLAEAKLALEFESVCEISRHFGPKGCPDVLWNLRDRYFRKMQNLK